MPDSNFIPRRYRADIPAIEAEYGELIDGKVISTSLQDFSKICPRDYLKIQAYQGLTNFSRNRYGVVLSLHSQKTKNE